MRLTKFGHACVRIEHDGVTVVLDPGVFTEPEAVDGADVVLITHEHGDHLDVDRLRRAGAPVVTIGAVARALGEQAPDLAERVRVVTPGERLDLAATSGAGSVLVEVVGERHAVIHPDLPSFDNSGYVLTLGDQRVYHPGDALTPPPDAVDLLLAPVSAPWMKVSEGIDFALEVGAPRNLAIHEKIYSDLGLGFADTHFGRFLGERDQEWVRLPDGADL